MNPQIEKQISELLELVKNGADQLPPYLQTLAHQAVISELVSSIGGLVFAAGGLTTAALLALHSRKLYKKARDNNDKDYNNIDDFDYAPWTGSASFLAIISTLFVWVFVPSLLRCLYCPDLVAFEAIRGLMQ